MLEDCCNGEVLGRKISRTLLAGNPNQRHDILRAVLLQPQTIYVDVAHFRNALSIKNSLRGSRVQLEPDAHVRAHILAHGLDAQTLAGPTDNAIELRLR